MVGKVANKRFRQETGLDKPSKKAQTSAAAKTLGTATKKAWLKSKVGEIMSEKTAMVEEEVSYIVKNKKTKEVISTHAKEDDARKKRDEIGTKDQYGIYQQRHAGALKNRKS